jgi:hypothetical protein
LRMDKINIGAQDEVENRVRRITFWLLLTSATTSLAFLVLFAKTPSTNHTFELILTGGTAALIITAFVVGYWTGHATASTWRPSEISAVILFAELIFAVYGVVEIATHLHSL